MSAKSILLYAGIVLFVVLTIPKPVFGLSEVSERVRFKRAVFVVIALALVLTGAYWK